MGKTFEKRKLRERREKVSIFPGQEEKFCCMQIEGKDNNKEGTKIEEKTTAFIVCLYSLYGTFSRQRACFLRQIFGRDF